MPFSPAQFASPWPDPLAGMDRLGLAIEKVQMAKQRAEAQRQEEALGWARLREVQRHNAQGEGLMGQHYSQIDDRARAQQAQAESHFQQTHGLNLAKQKQELEAKAQAAFMRGGPMDPDYVLYRQQMDSLTGAPTPAASQPEAPPEPQAPVPQEAVMRVAPVSPEQQQIRVNAQQHLSKVLGMKAGEGSAGEAMNGVDLVPKVIEPAALPQGGAPVLVAQAPAVAAARDPFDPMLRAQALAANAEASAKAFDSVIAAGGHRFTKEGMVLGRALAAQLAQSGRSIKDAVEAGMRLAQQEASRRMSEQNAQVMASTRRLGLGDQEMNHLHTQAEEEYNNFVRHNGLDKVNANITALDKAIEGMSSSNSFAQQKAIMNDVKATLGAPSDKEMVLEKGLAGKWEALLNEFNQYTSGGQVSEGYRRKFIDAAKQLRRGAYLMRDRKGMQIRDHFNNSPYDNIRDAQLGDYYYSKVTGVPLAPRAGSAAPPATRATSSSTEFRKGAAVNGNDAAKSLLEEDEE